MKNILNKKSIDKKYMLLAIFIFLSGLLIIGGTVAYLSSAVNVVNGNYVTNTKCFDVTYTDNTDQITGTLFPSANAGGGLSGSVSFVRDATCAVNGKGTLYLNVDSGSSNVLTSTVAPHCENKYTLETLGGYTETDCNVNDNTIWVTNGTALKYAVYDSASRTNLYATGYIDSSFIGTDKAIHTDFSINNTSKTYYLYIWLDGHISDDTYTDLSFRAHTKLIAVNVDSTAITYTGDGYTTITSEITQYVKFNDVYQIVEYIQSSGTQWINTGVTPTNLTVMQFKFRSLAVTGDVILGYFPNSDTNDYRFFNYGSSIYFDFPTGKRINGGSCIVGTDYNFEFGNYYVKDLNTNTILLSGTEVGLFTGTGTITINNYNNSRYAQTRIYSLKIYEDGVLLRDFIPVHRITEDDAGLYDIVNGVFYPDAAGGTFTYG